MPESAEVKLTAEYLHSKLYNRIIKEWVFTGGQYEINNPDGFEEFEEMMPFLVESVKCKGKLIYITLYNQEGYFYILHSLRMTGRWQEYEDKYCRWIIELNNGSKLWFRNPRCLATLMFTSDKKVFQSEIDKLGPDILTKNLNVKAWSTLIFKHANKNITSFLMNQNIISGVGNYIKAEALYYSKISPLRKVGSLSTEESDKLFEAIRIIPRIAYCKRGLSLKDFADKDGKKGEYESELKIYGKPKARRTKTADGRTTYWDPNVQQ